MMYPAILFFICTIFIAPVCGANPLESIKLVDLPEEKVRIDFTFKEAVHFKPLCQVNENPLQLTLTFPSESFVTAYARSTAKAWIPFYEVRKEGQFLRIVFNLQQTIPYTLSQHGKKVSLLLQGPLQKKHNFQLTSHTTSPDQDLTHLKKKITLNFQKIPVRAVLQLLADFVKINLIVKDNVHGDITLRLQDIPWNEALDIILRMQGLNKRLQGNILIIEKRGALARNTDTKVEMVQSELIPVNYAKATELATLINNQQNSLLSPVGKVAADSRTNTLWVQDKSSFIAEIKRALRQFDVPVKQVLIEARIIEVSKDSAQDLGIRWGMAPGAQREQGTTIPLQKAGGGQFNLDLVASSLGGLTPAALGLALAHLNNNHLLDLELSALESEGKAELVSSPRLITTNQQPAIIDSGQEIPYQETTGNGATAVTFRKAVLSLRVLPQITPDNKILLELKINQDSTSAQMFNGVPAILTKEIQTHVLVNNGQTIVLGGIYQQDKTSKVTRVPFLGKIPVVGNLFRNKHIAMTNEELLIFITPKIITSALKGKSSFTRI